MKKPEWKELYSVSASTYNKYVWVDLSLLFDCPEGLDRVATYLHKDRIECMFHWDYPEANNGYGGTYEKYGHTIILNDDLRSKWLEWQQKATNYSEEYDEWQKNIQKWMAG